MLGSTYEQIAKGEKSNATKNQVKTENLAVAQTKKPVLQKCKTGFSTTAVQ